jgi:hypothetical protein
MATIYMPLLNEGVNMWRPVEGTPVGSETFRVEGEMPEGEEWAFISGTIVRCERSAVSGAEPSLIIVGLAD